MEPIEKSILEEFKSRLQERLHVHKVILFGSRARGDADLESDLDVVVVLEDGIDAAAREYVSDCAWLRGRCFFFLLGYSHPSGAPVRLEVCGTEWFGSSVVGDDYSSVVRGFDGSVGQGKRARAVDGSAVRRFRRERRRAVGGSGTRQFENT